MRINVGPPFITISHGNTFLVTDLNGQVQPDATLGLFSDDTRFLSYYACYIDGHAWTRLMSTNTMYYASRTYLTNPAFTTEMGDVPADTVSLVISRTVENGVHEDLDMTNYGRETVSFSLEISLRSDFADIFEVIPHQFVRRGVLETRWDDDQQTLDTTYQHDDFYRCLSCQIHHAGIKPHYANGRITFEIELKPGETWHTCCLYTLIANDVIRQPTDKCYEETVDQDVINTEIERLDQQWFDSVTCLTSSNDDLERIYQQSVRDFSALRLYDYDFASSVWLPAAGVPKYVTIFGRDSLIASLQNVIAHPGFARGTLKKLAQLQANEQDDWRDAQPGKMLHEVRNGELSYFGQIPHTPYYGTADATTLYLITLHEAWKWLGDDSLLRDYRDTILRSLDWIDQYGDMDGDGFQEYQRRSSSPYSLENQGWKDSDDSVVYPDGRQVPAPKTLCELQGYVFDAWFRMAEVFDALGEGDRADELRAKAKDLHHRFESQFWCDDLGFYAFALDLEKQPVKTITSNPGHCLWSGIVSPDRAVKVVQRLLQPDMNSGWGIRTLNTHNPAFNPFSYHLGSVWPHDNGIMALGFKRYGFDAEAAGVAHDIFDAATYFTSFRLPELYAGLDKQPGTFPVPYIEANVPQAWAAGSVFHLLQALLGIRADAPCDRLYIQPSLPDWLPDVTLRRLCVGNASVDLRVWREGDRTCWDATCQSGSIEIQEKPWQQWLD